MHGPGAAFVSYKTPRASSLNHHPLPFFSHHPTFLAHCSGPSLKCAVDASGLDPATATLVGLTAAETPRGERGLRPESSISQSDLDSPAILTTILSQNCIALVEIRAQELRSCNYAPYSSHHPHICGGEGPRRAASAQALRRQCSAHRKMPRDDAAGLGPWWCLGWLRTGRISCGKLLFLAEALAAVCCELGLICERRAGSRVRSSG